MAITSHPYDDKIHHQPVLAFIRNVRPPERLEDYPTIIDLEEQLPQSEIQENAQLWYDDDILIACAFVDHWDNIWFDFYPQYQDDIGSQIIQFGVSRIQARLLDGENGSLETNCSDNFNIRRLFLEMNGFTPLPEQTLVFSKSLTGSLPNPSLPSGYQIRSLMGRAEAGAAAELHRLAFNSDYMTTENRLAIMETPEYDPTLDLVITAPDGRLAAYAMGGMDNSENEQEKHQTGHIDPIATHPDYQHRGLARALILAGCLILRERGIKLVRFGTSSENHAMIKTAESTGFMLESRKTWFRRLITSPTTSSAE